MATTERAAPTSLDYQTLADLRYQIRKFVGVRETAARQAGVEPQQYLVLLQLKGLRGRAPATIGALAERLQLKHHSTVELVDRLVARSMVKRRKSRDRRKVLVAIAPQGATVLRRLAKYSLDELQGAGPELVRTLTRLIRGAGRAR